MVRKTAIRPIQGPRPSIRKSNDTLLRHGGFHSDGGRVERIPKTAAWASAGPYGRMVIALRAVIRHDDALLEIEALAKFPQSGQDVVFFQVERPEKLVEDRKSVV